MSNQDPISFNMLQVHMVVHTWGFHRFNTKHYHVQMRTASCRSVNQPHKIILMVETNQAPTPPQWLGLLGVLFVKFH